MNRLDRDAILIRALDLTDSPTLDNHDRPSATIVAGAYSVVWLQDGLDLAVQLYPEASLLKTSVWPTGGFVAGTDTYNLPTDYVQVYEDGVLLDGDEGRLHQRGLSWLLQWKTGSTYRGKPKHFGVLKGAISGTVGKMLVRPVPDKAYTATLYYYSLPAVLAASTIPSFPSDQVLVEYVHLRAKEWVQAVPLRTAEQFLRAAMGELQRAGLGSETEPDVIKIDRDIFPGGGEAPDRNTWMGNPNL